MNKQWWLDKIEHCNSMAVCDNQQSNGLAFAIVTKFPFLGPIHIMAKFLAVVALYFCSCTLPLFVNI